MKQTSRPELGERKLEQPVELAVWKMLDHLGGEDGAEGVVREAFEVGVRVSLNHVQPQLAATRHHPRVGVHATGRDARVGEQREHLAATAADVEDWLVACQERQIWPLGLPHAIARTAEEGLERHVAGSIRRQRRARVEAHHLAHLGLERRKRLAVDVGDVIEGMLQRALRARQLLGLVRHSLQ